MSRNVGVRKVGVTVLAAIGLLWGSSSAEAIPAYARKHQVACSLCHSAWPLLNQYGRTFKENGYRLDREPKAAAAEPEIEIEERLALALRLPMSFRVQSRPFVKRSTDSRFDMQVVHEFEFQISDGTAGNMSYFVNFEAADDAGWAAELADLVAGWHPRTQANIVGGFGPLTFVDPYNTFSSRRLTQDRPSPNSAGFQSGYRFRDDTQFGSFYGRAGGLFYSASVGTGAGDTIGADKKDYLLRAAYDLPVGVSIGAFSLTGDKELTTPLRTQDYSRAGADVQIERGQFTANAVWYQADEEAAATLVGQKNNAWYVQALYTLPTKAPVVPIVRYESVESNDGADTTDSVALALLAYVRGNVNVSLDYTTQTKVPPGRAETHRFSVLVIFGM
jgi:hypothetical protein